MLKPAPEPIRIGFGDFKGVGGGGQVEFLGDPFERVIAAGKDGDFKAFFIFPGEAGSLCRRLLLRLGLGLRVMALGVFPLPLFFFPLNALSGFAIGGPHFGFGLFLVQSEVFEFFDCLGVRPVRTRVPATDSRGTDGCQQAADGNDSQHDAPRLARINGVDRSAELAETRPTGA